jgi:hypothetical protein
LAHQARILVLKDVTVQHEWVSSRRRLIEGDEKFRPIFDKNHVFPTL